VETQLKQRLTGAVILVALIVLLVPEILSGPPARRAASESAPEVGKMHSYTIDLTHDAVPMAAAETSVVAAGVAAEDANKPAADNDQPASEPVTDVASIAVPEAAEERAPVVEETIASPQGDSRGAFAVQVGSFGKRENAERLTRELRSRGFPAYVNDPVGTGRTLAKVRVGPVADRTAANALLEQLRQAGQSGAVVPNP
jgi:DedD protein